PRLDRSRRAPRRTEREPATRAREARNRTRVLCWRIRRPRLGHLASPPARALPAQSLAKRMKSSRTANAFERFFHMPIAPFGRLIRLLILSLPFALLAEGAVSRSEVRIRDPFVLPDPATQTYVIYGTTTAGIFDGNIDRKAVLAFRTK